MLDVVKDVCVDLSTTLGKNTQIHEKFIMWIFF